MRRSAIVFLVLSLVLVACRASSAESTQVADPPGAPTTTSSTVATSTSSSTTTALPGPLAIEAEVARLAVKLDLLEQQRQRLLALLKDYPLTFETEAGTVTIASRPERIVSMSATHTEMLYAAGAGDQVVATDLTSNYPAAAESTSKVDSFNFSVEEVAALDPDLVILAFDFQGEGDALSTLGIPFLLLGPPDTLESALFQFLTVAGVTGHYDEAGPVLNDLIEEIDRIDRSADPIRGITIYHEVDETLYSTTSASFIGDLYSRLGLVNIADESDAGGGAFPQLSAEFIVDQDPEIIFLADANFGVTSEAVAARPGWDTIRAVTNGNIVELDGDLAGRWGPRTVDLLRSILEAVEARVP